MRKAEDPQMQPDPQTAHVSASPIGASDEIDAVLRALATSNPAHSPDSTFEQRLLQRLARHEAASRHTSLVASLHDRVRAAWDRTSISGARTAGWPAVAVCTACLACATTALYVYNAGRTAPDSANVHAPGRQLTSGAAASTADPARVARAGHSNSNRESAVTDAREQAVAKRDVATTAPVVVSRASGPMIQKAAGHVQRPAELTTVADTRANGPRSSAPAAGLPLQRAPLTQEERLLLQIARSGDSDSFALLDPQARARTAAEERASTDRFFAPQPLPPDLQAEIDNAVRAQYTPVTTESSPAPSSERTLP